MSEAPDQTDGVLDVGNRIICCGRTFAVSYVDQRPRSRWQNMVCCFAAYSAPFLNRLCWICLAPVLLTIMLLIVCLALAATPEFLQSENKTFQQKFRYAAEGIFTVYACAAAVVLGLYLLIAFIMWICNFIQCHCRRRTAILPTVRAI